MILWVTPGNLGDLRRVRTKEPGKQRFWGQQDSSLPSQVEQLYRMVLPPAGDNRSSAGKRSHSRLQPFLPATHVPQAAALLSSLPRRLHGLLFYSRQTGAQRSEMKGEEECLTCSVTPHLATNPRHPLDTLPHQYLPWCTGGSWSSEAIANIMEARRWIFLSLERHSTAISP